MQHHKQQAGRGRGRSVRFSRGQRETPGDRAIPEHQGIEKAEQLTKPDLARFPNSME